MKTYKVTVHRNETTEEIEISEETVKAKGNIQRCVFVLFNQKSVDKIEVELQGTKGTYKEVTYDKTLEYYRYTLKRVEIEWKEGWEDFTGYGARKGIDGKKTKMLHRKKYRMGALLSANIKKQFPWWWRALHNRN